MRLAPLYMSDDATHTDDGEALDASRPPFSFTCLIGMAILAANKWHISVAEVYAYILAAFPYFKTAKPTWRNSVRHVLSLGKFFEKVSPHVAAEKLRTAGYAGKGALWGVKPEALSSLLCHIEAAERQLAPSTSRHLQLDRLRSRAAVLQQRPRLGVVDDAATGGRTAAAGHRIGSQSALSPPPPPPPPPHGRDKH